MRNDGVYVYVRKRKTKPDIYYAKFRLSDGTWSTGKNTEHTNRDAAERWAEEQIDAGKVERTGGPDPTLDAWAAGFFGVGGRYDLAKRARGRELSACYLENLRRSYDKYLSKPFGKRRVSEITALELETFFLDLYNDPKLGISGSTVNGVLRAARALFAEAERLEVIRRNPALRVGRFAEKNRERGTLTKDELDTLFGESALTDHWDGNQVSSLIAMVAVACGLRHGEIVCLRPCDIGDGLVRVHRAWNRAAKQFGPPKWGSAREVPCPQRLVEEVTAFVEDYGIDQESLLFPSVREPHMPIEAHEIGNHLRDALESVGILKSEQKRDKRFLDLHALRHTYITRLRTDGNVPDWQVQRAAGHKSLAMTDHYTHVGGKDLRSVASAAILPFRERAG